MKKNIVRCMCGIGVMIMLCGTTVHSKSMSGMLFEESYNAAIEAGKLVEQGYSPEEAMVKAYQEAYGITPSYSTDSEAESDESTEVAAPTCTHTWTENITKEPTCTEKGKKTITCNKCGESKSESVAKTEHAYSITGTTVGNCIEAGTITYTCKACGDSYTDETVFGEHSFELSEESVEVTCLLAGYTKKICTLCGKIETTTQLPLGCEAYSTPTSTKAATCTESGEKEFTCIRCGEVVKTEEIPATGHTKSETPVVAVEPTLTKEGLQQYVCGECGTVLEEYVLPHTGGIWIYVVPVAATGVLAIGGVVLLVRSRKKRI